MMGERKLEGYRIWSANMRDLMCREYKFSIIKYFRKPMYNQIINKLDKKIGQYY